jgi:hypothetical protein
VDDRAKNTALRHARLHRLQNVVHELSSDRWICFLCGR